MVTRWRTTDDHFEIWRGLVSKPLQRHDNAGDRSIERNDTGLLMKVMNIRQLVDWRVGYKVDSLHLGADAKKDNSANAAVQREETALIVEAAEKLVMLRLKNTWCW